MRAALAEDDGLSEEAKRVAAVVAEAREMRAAGTRQKEGGVPSKSAYVDIGAVDVDVCLSLSHAHGGCGGR